MRRDMNLVRDILLKLEDHADPLDWAEIAIEGRSELEISYHIMLMDEAGLITATDCSSNDGLAWEAKSLTWHGHEFLDAARNPTVWKKSLDLVGGAMGAVSFAVVVEVLKREALRALGLAA